MRLRGILALPIVISAWVASVPAQAQGSGAANGIPVTTASVVRQDVPIVLRALGTVQAFQSVLVRARVDGTLDKVLFTEGQTVKPGDLLAEIDPRPYQAALDQAVAKKEYDEANLASVRADMTRYTDLASAQVASRQKLEQTRAAMGQAEANIRGDDAAIAAAQLNLTFTRITSPIEGRVGLRITDVGNFIRVADNNQPGIVIITQIHPIALTFTLPQDALASVQAAMRAGRLPVAAYSANGKDKLADGELLTMESTIDASTGTIKLKAVFANANEALWPGQFVDVQLETGIRKNVPTVPSEVVQRGPNGLYVYVIKPDSTVERKTITVAQDDGEKAVIASGLAGGETVVAGGQSRLTNGSPVVASNSKPAG
jgi:multidrug efflux system membrane fusion protein